MSELAPGFPQCRLLKLLNSYFVFFSTVSYSIFVWTGSSRFNSFRLLKPLLKREDIAIFKFLSNFCVNTEQAPGYPTSLDCQVAAVPVPAVAWLRSTFRLRNIRSRKDFFGNNHLLHRNGKRVTSDGKYAITISDYRDGWLTVSLLIPAVSLSQWVCNHKQLVCNHSTCGH